MLKCGGSMILKKLWNVILSIIKFIFCEEEKGGDNNKMVLEMYNRDILSLMQKLDDIKKELEVSQSSRLHVGLLDFDAERLEKELAHILAHAKALKPVDFPETHPTVVI
jgi:hypothetical protein